MKVRFSDIRHVTQDSREVRPGDWFVACEGENLDGHDFIADALARGATGVLEEEELFSLAREKLEELAPVVIGVTGSVGKTTTKEMIASLLGEKYPVQKSPENINTRRGLSLFILNELRSNHRVLVVEIAMDREGEIAETCETVKPDIGVITTISETHLGKLGSLGKIKDTKAGLLDALGSEGTAVLNADDENVVDISSRASGKIIWFGMGDERADILASDVRMNLEGTEFSLFKRGSRGGYGEEMGVRISLLGDGGVYAALAAAAIAFELDLSFSQIKNGLSKLSPLPQRLNLIKSRGEYFILDDSYNASDLSTVAALRVLEELPAHRRIAVLGDMLELGRHEVAAHRRVGRKTAAVADLLLVVGECLFCGR